MDPAQLYHILNNPEFQERETMNRSNLHNGETNPILSLVNCIALDTRDWSRDRCESWIYGIICGWEDSINEIAKKHGWSESTVERLQYLHEQFKKMIVISTTPEEQPRIISLGEGKVLMGCGTTPDGQFGIIFEPGDTPHEVGAMVDGYEEQYTIQAKDTIIKCANRQAALVLLETVKELVGMFPLPEDNGAGT